MKTVQKQPLNMFKFGMGCPYQRYGLSEIFYPYQRMIKNGVSINWTGTVWAYQTPFLRTIPLV